METAAKNVLYERRSFGKAYSFIHDTNKRPTFSGKFAKHQLILKNTDQRLHEKWSFINCDYLWILQIREVPEDFFVDIVSSNNFLVTLLTTLFSLARDNISIDPKLKARIEKFKKSLSLKFNWDFSEIDDGEEPDEDKPVIVQI